MMATLLQTLFWVSSLGLVYIYAGYPLLVWFGAHRFPRPVVKQSARRSLSIVIVAHNEAKTVGRKLASLLSCAKSEWIDEILIGSDGSTDETVAVARANPDARIRVIDFSERRGKPAVLNELVPQCRSEIVLLADSRQEFHVDCLERLLENFADSSVGVVSGELVLVSQPGATVAAEGIGFYWKYEKFIRKSESQFRGVPGATGACYAIRKFLFRPIPDQTILDDVAIPLLIVQQGYRCLFEPGALIYDVPSASTRKEAIRKRRTISGAAQLVRLFPQWLVPFRNPLWFEFISHKLLRLASPVLLLTVLFTNVALVESPTYQFLLLAQAGFYAAAALGWLSQSIGRRVACFGPPLMFMTLNVTTLLALWDVLRSRYRVTWKKSME